jgi:uncharacterized protein
MSRIRTSSTPFALAGSTALVTGASRGIGATFARRLAAEGADVVLVARDRSRLSALAAELECEHGVRTLVVVVDLTHLYLPAMVERGSGAIVNVASTAAFQPVPYLAVYSASNAFVLTFGEALRFELAGTGVRVLSLCPGPTDTEFFTHTGDGAGVGRMVAPTAVVDAAVSGLRRDAGTVVVGGRRRRWLFFRVCCRARPWSPSQAGCSAAPPTELLEKNG